MLVSGLGCFLSLWICLSAFSLPLPTYSSGFSDLLIVCCCFFSFLLELWQPFCYLGLAEHNYSWSKKKIIGVFIYSSFVLSPISNTSAGPIDSASKIYILNLSLYSPTLIPLRTSSTGTDKGGPSLVSQLTFFPIYWTFSIEQPEWSLKIQSNHVIPCLKPSSGFPQNLH